MSACCLSPGERICHQKEYGGSSHRRQGLGGPVEGPRTVEGADPPIEGSPDGTAAAAGEGDLASAVVVLVARGGCSSNTMPAPTPAGPLLEDVRSGSVTRSHALRASSPPSPEVSASACATAAAVRSPNTARGAVARMGPIVSAGRPGNNAHGVSERFLGRNAPSQTSPRGRALRSASLESRSFPARNAACAARALFLRRRSRSVES